jgi:hypothetical protein
MWYSATLMSGKQSHNRPSVAQRVPGLGSQIFQDTQHMKVVRLSALCTGRLYPQEMFLVLIFTRGWVDPRATVWSEGMSLKNPVTPPGIDPGTIRLVAQHLNHHATPGNSTILNTRLMVSFVNGFGCMWKVSSCASDNIVFWYVLCNLEDRH